MEREAMTRRAKRDKFVSASYLTDITGFTRRHLTGKAVWVFLRSPP